MTKLEQTLAHIFSQQMQRGSFKRIGQRYLVRLLDGTYTGALSLKQAKKLIKEG